MKGSPVRVRASALAFWLEQRRSGCNPCASRGTQGRGRISILALTLRFAVATVLAVAALAKARDFASFRRTVEALVPWRRGTVTAAAVVATEAALAVLLAAGVVPSAVAAVTIGLFSGFAALSL